jgi:hypothetical protein
VRVLVTGSRDWQDRLAVYRALNEVCNEHGLNYPPDEHGNTMPDPEKITVVHGACPTGADLWADEWCISNFFEAERYHAEWNRFGKRAGFLRNAQMVEDGADLCLAFIKNESKGASMTARLAEQAGIKTVRFVQ